MRLAQSLAAGLILAALSIPPALPQLSNRYNGNWIASFETEKGRPLQAEVQIKGDVGTWMNTGHRKQNPCTGKTMPIAITRSTDAELDFAVYGSKVLTGCADHTYSLKVRGDNTLEGQRNDGRKITLQRR